MEFFDVLARRKSTRAYAATPLTPAEVDKILFAARSAPVGGAHYENVHLSAVQNPDLVARIRAAASAGGNDPYYGAPFFVFVSVKARPSSPNVEFANAACVVENMHLAATALDLASVYIWGCLPALRADAVLKAELGIPEGFEPVSAIAVGHPADGAPAAPRDFSSTYATTVLL